jgi:uncharacterized membrane protein YfcA
MEIFTCLAIGLLGGVFSGLMGIGGGIVLIPLMTIFLKFSQHQAQGTSLAVIFFSFASAFVYYKKGYLNITTALLIGAGFIAGGILGAYCASLFSEQILKKVFAVLMIICAAKILFFK